MGKELFTIFLFLKKIHIVGDLLRNKLGDLSQRGQESTDQFEFFAQHFDRPLTKSNI